MNILWIVNNVLPELAHVYGLETSASGSWLEDWSQKLAASKGINLAVACVYGTEYKRYKVNNTTYYLLPGTGRNMMFYTKKYESLWQRIAEEFKPDIVHLHGTEYSHGLSFLRSNPSVKSIVSVQGIISRIADNMFDGLPILFSLRYFTIREILKMNNVWCRAMLYKYNSRYEREIFQRVHYANVVNSWDKSLSEYYNPKIKTVLLQYNLRNAFYSAPKWNIEKIHKFRIFTNPCGDPIKGMHILFKAIGIVKKQYPDVALCIPAKSFFIKANSGYEKYLVKLATELHIEKNISFLGRLNEQKMIENMLMSHAVVVPSAIEGTSLVLREAMYLGVPCIASFRGGMADFIRDKETGFLYDFEEYTYLANRISLLFRDNHLANTISKAAIVQAENAHNRERNIQELIEMYSKVYNEV